MLKRIVSMLLCVVFSVALVPENTDEYITVNAAETDFGDRLLYGGTAVDVGDDTVYSENGALWRITADGIKTQIADTEAKYLNYYENMLWFVSGSRIMKCAPDGSGMVCVLEFEGEVKCLYVTEDGLLYLRGETVYFNRNGKETSLLTRSGIEGFVPEANGNIRWTVKNPDYVYVEENGDEVWTDGGDEYLQYLSAPNSEAKYDTSAASATYGTALATNATDYSGPYVQVGEITLPLEEHMPGTFFSKNGEACVCHNTSSTYCIQSVGNCNCMRYYPTGYANTCEVDLLGAQCFAFARMIFWKCFGFIDHSMNQSLYYSVGSLSSGAVTANSVKALLMKAAPGSHVRLAAGHSVSILTMDEDFIVIYHGNAGGDGVATAPCVVSTRRYTWEQFANACAKGILYVNMPYNYPDSEVILTKKEIGYYKLKANLNLREEANTASTSLAVIPNGTIIEVTEVDGFWGKTSYNGCTGWAFLEYTTFFSRETISPSGDVFVLGEDGYLRAKAWKLTFDSFSEHFDKQSISVVSGEGIDLSAEGFIGTGSLVSLTVDGVVVDKATVCIAGDLNGNGALDVGDYLLVKRAYFGTYKPTEVQTAAADVTGDGIIDSYDYMLIRRFFFNPDAALFAAFGNN